MSQQLALRQEDGSEALLSVLKALEIGKAMAEPVLTAVRRFPAEPARFADFPARAVRHGSCDVLRARGIEQLYTHQRQAYDAVQDGRHTVVVTPTASGKTLCYNLPVLDRILKDPDARALYLFPTKALAQDQLAELYAMVEALGADIGTFTYDGDTPQDARKAIRSRAHVVVTNPDMLHKGILPHHTKWVKLFENLRYVIVDELHSLRGVYGSHVANLFRRLRRLCRFYGSDPQFLCSSATIGNPRELAEALTGREMTLIDQSGAPRGERYFAIYNPPVVNRQLGIRRSALGCARDVALSFLGKGLQTIVFAPSRLSTEILVTYLKEALETRPGSEGVIRGYRGGYLPLEAPRDRARPARGLGARRRLHERAGAGHRHRPPRRGGAARLPGQRGLGLAAGGARRPPRGHLGRGAGGQLDAAEPVHRQDTPTTSSTRRSSRRASTPTTSRSWSTTSSARPSSCPSPPTRASARRTCGEVLRFLEEQGLLHRAGARWHWTSESYPADAVSLRSVSSDNFVVQDVTAGRDPRIIAEVDFDSAPSTLHEKAVYILEGRTFFVVAYDHEQRRAQVREAEVDYYTDAITYTKVKILDRFAEQPVARARRNHGEVHVTSQVVGFKKIKFHTNENVGSGELQMPENQMHTTSYWLTVPREVMAALPFTLRGAARRGGGALLHAGPARGALPDVRPPRPRRGRGRQRPGRGARGARAAPGGLARRGARRAPARTTSRTSSSTTTTRAASASPSRSTTCTRGCSRRAGR